MRCFTWKPFEIKLEKQQKLLTLMKKFKDLFDGTLGRWNKELVKVVKLKANATSYHIRLYPIPRCHAETLKIEVDGLVAIGVFKKISRFE
jgi:hypothetical protein